MLCHIKSKRHLITIIYIYYINTNEFYEKMTKVQLIQFHPGYVNVYGFHKT